MFLRRLIGNRRGSISVIAALALVGLIGMTGLAVDLNRGYELRIVNQRVADMAALAAAVAYNANKSEAILQPTAQDLVTVQGVANATVTALLVTDVPTAGAKAVRVTLTAPLAVTLARVVGAGASYPVTVTATASLVTQSVPSCIVGLASSGNAIETQGGATIATSDCGVAGVGSIANNGSGITAKNIVSGSGNIVNNYGTLSADQLRYAGQFSNPDWNANVPPPDKRVNQATTISDPLDGNLELGAARNKLGTYRTPKALTDPTTPAGESWVFGGSPSAAVRRFQRGQSSSFTVPKGQYRVDSMSADGDATVVFEPGSTVTVARGVTIGGGARVTFGDGIFRINGGFTGGSNGVTFGNGELHIGSGTVSFAGTNRIGDGPVTIAAPLSLGGGTTLAVGAGNHLFGGIAVAGGSWLTLGNGNLDVTGKVSVGGGSTIIAGAGDVTLANPGARAIDLEGSGNFFMGDGLFSANGDIVTAGGSRLAFGRTANHLINGDLKVAGAVLFGKGRYTIKGSFTNGTGGTTWPYTSPIDNVQRGATLEGVSVSDYDMAGIDVTLILGGTLDLSGGAKTKLTAPAASTPDGGIADILIDSLTTNDTNWGGGSNNLFVGVVHLPRSTLTISGGNSTQTGGRCFMLILSRLLATGGATAGVTCNSVATGSGGSGSVELVG
jgi:Flp pilus assembly protein TadG